MKNFRVDFEDNRPSGKALEVLSGRYVTTYSETAITYDPITGKIISIIVTAEDELDVEMLVVSAARSHFKSWAILQDLKNK